MTSFIKVPFASSGDKAVVPDTDSGGGVNMTQGYGQAYSMDPATDPSAKRIERDKMNWLFNRITQAINEIQSGGVAPFITSADNGGSAFSYGKGALVSLGGVVYQSLVASNTSTPPGANWAAFPDKIQPLDATLTALAGLVGAANKLPYFNGTDTATLTDLTSVGRDIIGKNAIADVLTYLGLTAITTVAGATDRFPYFSGPNSARLTPLTDFARNLLSKPDDIDARTALGLGNAATRNIGTANGTVAAGDDNRFNLMLAVNQTYQDVRSSRVVNTSYTNSTGKPIFIVVSAVQDSQGNPVVLTATIDNQVITTYSYGSNAVGTLTLPVPNGSTYKINVSNGTNPRVINWLELR
ncbi:hypothetical protein [Citrobacter portucalensis]|uniref:hypothetical protein n=1 Tax=Citrobacter portucalensis TaxID=1639133 RepID=UPI002B474EB9|nr:hypothetical protein [Citrobacter portucalensis]